jgi:hypothetical protein
MILDGVYFKAAIDGHKEHIQEDLIRQRLAEYQKLGITYLRDGGDAWNVALTARTMAQEYGITYVAPAFPIHRKGRYGWFIGRSYESREEYIALLDEAEKKQADFVKIMFSGLMDFNTAGALSCPPLDGEEMKELTALAHQRGFAVMVHCNGARTAEAAACAGVDSIDHGAYLDCDALHAMAENGTVWVPTLSTIGNLRGKGRFREEAVQAILESALQNVRKFAAIGGLIAPGTDAGAWAVPHGSETEVPLLTMALGSDTEAILAKGIATIQKKF